MKTLASIAIIAAAVLVAGCAPNDDPIMWAAIEARTGRTRAQIEKEEADHRARMRQETLKFEREMAALRKVEQKRLRDNQALANEFCPLSPVQRDAKVQADWEIEKNRPGSAYTSYGHLRVVMLRKTGC